MGGPGHRGALVPLQTQGWVTLDWKHPCGSAGLAQMQLFGALGSWLLQVQRDEAAPRLPSEVLLSCSSNT